VAKRALAGVVAAAMLAAGCHKAGTPSPGVWAVVNGTEIQRAEVEKYYRLRVNPQGPAPSQEESLSLMLNILDALINNQILLQRAQKLGLQASDGEVEDKFTESKSPYTEDEFQRQLQEQHLTVDDLKNGIREELSIQKLINREVVAKITITDQDVAEFYSQNRQQFDVPETRYELAQIVVTPRKDPEVRNRKNDDATTDVEARRKIAALYQKLQGGADFAELAMDYSEDPQTTTSGGEMGFFPESAIASDPDLKKAVMGLQPGQFTGVIQFKDAYRIIKLIAKQAPGQRELSDPQVQQTIREALRSRKEQLLRAAYLAEARDDAKVVNYLAQQVMESNGRLPVISPPSPAVGSSPAPQTP